MSTLLHIDASPVGSDSISKQLTAEFVKNWKLNHAGGRVITRDLTQTTISPVDSAWVAAAFTPKADRTAEHRATLALSDTLVAELREADEYVIGTPMHNFGIASGLKLWIDQIARAGETFSYSPNGPVGLLENKKATFMIASGGVYDRGTAMESFNFVEPYLRAVFNLLGVTDTQFHVAGGVAQIRTGVVDREAFLKPYVQSIQATFQAA